MIDLQQRYETIKSACENLKLQTKATNWKSTSSYHLTQTKGT